MLIQTNTRAIATKTPVRQASTPAQTEEATANTPTETFTPSSSDTKPKRKYKAWEPLAAGAVVAGAVGIPSLIAAVGVSTIGATATGIALPLVAGVGTGYAMLRSSRKNNFPLVASALGAGVAGVLVACASPLLALPGANWGVQGAMIGAGAVGGLASIVAAFGMAQENKKIDEQNRTPQA